MATIISGKDIAGQLKIELMVEVTELKKRGVEPGLATILVGDDPASKTYVKGKIKTCEQLGIQSFHYPLSAETKEAELLGLIDFLNRDQKVHGILCQLPLPPQINVDKVLLSIAPAKDVDCFHPENIGKFFVKKSLAEMENDGLFLPCTPYGIIQLLKRSGIPIKGAEAVVVGRSNIVGKPLAMLLLAENATVTVCHSGTKNLAQITRRADILVAAIGRKKFITAEMVKEGATVIDVGIHRLPEGGFSGDVDFIAVKEKVSAITPVPGGVGPMTIIMLMRNTVMAAKKLGRVN